MKLSLKILIHFIFWAVFLSATIAFMYGYNQKHFEHSKVPHLIINTVWAVVIFYLFYFYFIVYFEEGKFIKYLAASIFVSALVTFIFSPFHKIFYQQLQLFHYLNFGPTIIGTFILAQCGCLIRGFENWFDNIKLKSELENQNLKNELELLKSQVNPHFLFNTLNNIDSLIHKSPENASKSLISLSDMLRYMIYETNTDRVPLEKELENINRYIELQKLRLRKPEYINVILPDNCSQLEIAPMLLLPVLENAFKYATTEKGLPAINLKIICINSQLVFSCTNHFKTNDIKNTNSGGVGLDNLKRRLKIIYPDSHVLKILKENNIFNVQLKIDLK